MRSKFYAVISVVVVLTMLAVACGPAADTTAGAAGAGSKDPTTWVETSIGDPETLDPSLTYETGGGEIIQNHRNRDSRALETRLAVENCLVYDDMFAPVHDGFLIDTHSTTELFRDI